MGISVLKLKISILGKTEKNMAKLNIHRVCVRLYNKSGQDNF